MLRNVCFLSLLLALAPTAFPQDHSGETLITLQRTACYGSCPIYKLTIRGDGSVTYEGAAYVRVKGTQKSKIALAKVQDLVKSFMDANYFNLKNEYITVKDANGIESYVTDLPTTITSLKIGDRSMKVVDYFGAPQALRDLEGKIDRVADSRHWIFIDVATVHEKSEHGWDINGRDAQLLFIQAVDWGDIEVTRAFIEEGIDVNALPNGTPLQSARGVEVIRLLIKSGAKVNVKPNGPLPPLQLASELGDVDSVLALLKAGAKVNAASEYGITALMQAAHGGYPDVVKALLAAGADVHLKDSNGRNALDYAENWRSEKPSSLDPSVSILDRENRFKVIDDLLKGAGTDSGPGK